MTIPPHVVDAIMVKSGRHCCICRRFAPLYLQVHHIVERSKGGTDDPDNLISVCLTCHCDVHTKTLFTQRFSVEELKGHRKLAFTLVADGRLRAPDHPRQTDDIIAETLAHFSTAPATPNDLPKEAVILLITAAENSGMVYVSESMNGASVRAGIRTFEMAGPRDLALYRHAIDKLTEEELIEWRNNDIYRVTHEGYLLADVLMAAGNTAH